ncbi:hypothetical protein NEIMUCOT_05370 [Neisseria mucosa ATCC 25996]|uniref:Uncharacterized protein n=1 Tax=Neisseria mucosa (strain ATCC 25996 / DSM 4631 / NCTC 10774 / M26) TaxID=546266 RepID=D2ZXL6_NEIM2|nr:hypothetical protein NEIMUCOT_05370 [Neisseria mucosa ATCC 25996]
MFIIVYMIITVSHILGCQEENRLYAISFTILAFSLKQGCSCKQSL